MVEAAESGAIVATQPQFVRKRRKQRHLTPELTDAIVQYVAEGVPLRFAAQAVGIDVGTYYKWLHRGEREHGGMYHEFATRVEQALGSAVAANVATVKKAAEKQWQAAAWWLERVYPEQFGRRDAVALTGADGKPLQVEVLWEASWRKPIEAQAEAVER